MAALVPIEVLGFAPGDPVTSVQMNLVNTQLPKAPNFVDGLATYNPAGLIQVGGAGFRWNGPTLFASTSTTNFEGAANVQSATGRLYVNTSGQIVVQTSGEIVIQSGGAMTWESGALITAEDGSTFNLQDGSVLNLAGIMNFGATSEIHGDPTLMSGAELTLASGAAITAASGSTTTFASGSTRTASSGSTTTFNAGSTLNLGGTSTLTNSQTLELSPARSWVRHSLRIAMVSYVKDEAAPADNTFEWGIPAAWINNHVGALQTGFESPFIRTLPTDTASHSEQHYHWVGLDDLPHGGTFSQVIVTAAGGGDAPTTVPKFRIIRINSSGTVENMSALTDMSGTWTDTTQTTVSVNAHASISTSYRYALVVLHPILTGTGTPASEMRVIDVESNGTIASMAIG